MTGGEVLSKKKLYIAAAMLTLALFSACAKDNPKIPDNAATAVSPPVQEQTETKPVGDTAQNAEILEPPAESPAADPQTTKESVSGDGFLIDIETQVMNLINQERLSLGLTELEYDPMLQNTARIRSKELCQQMSDQTLAHERPDGNSWSTVMTRDIPIQNLIGAGEILAREKTTDGGGATQEPIPAKDWFLLWKSSQSHYDNITWPEAERMGVGIYFEIRNGEYYTNATVHFGIYANEPLPEAAK